MDPSPKKSFNRQMKSRATSVDDPRPFLKCFERWFEEISKNPVVNPSNYTSVNGKVVYNKEDPLTILEEYRLKNAKRVA